MRKSNNDIDKEVYILGSNNQEGRAKKQKPILWIILLICIAVGVMLFFFNAKKEDVSDYYFDPENSINQESSVIMTDTVNLISSGNIAYTQIIQDTINDVPLNIYIPHNAKMSLMLGVPDKNDSTLVFVGMAADIRKDNQEIVGDFVLSGKQLARGLAKKGFCAIIDNTITLGTADETPLLKQTINTGGFFFRQYPLVSNGSLVENKPKNKSIRRAIGIRNEKVLMVESQKIESFHDFSQALIDIGFSDAIYLVGGNAYGWFYDQNKTKQEFGQEEAYMPENVSYIVWKSN